MGIVENNGFAPVLFFTTGRQTDEAFALAQTLRVAGISVIEKTIERKHTSSITWSAQEARRQNISRVILYAGKKATSDSVVLLECLDSSKPRQSRITIQELPQRLRADTHGHI